MYKNKINIKIIIKSFYCFDESKVFIVFKNIGLTSSYSGVWV